MANYGEWLNDFVFRELRLGKSDLSKTFKDIRTPLVLVLNEYKKYKMKADLGSYCDCPDSFQGMLSDEGRNAILFGILPECQKPTTAASSSGPDAGLSFKALCGVLENITPFDRCSATIPTSFMDTQVAADEFRCRKCIECEQAQQAGLIELQGQELSARSRVAKEEGVNWALMMANHGVVEAQETARQAQANLDAFYAE